MQASDKFKMALDIEPRKHDAPLVSWQRLHIPGNVPCGTDPCSDAFPRCTQVHRLGGYCSGAIETKVAEHSAGFPDNRDDEGA